jgi:hypothetical protein
MGSCCSLTGGKQDTTIVAASSAVAEFTALDGDDDSTAVDPHLCQVRLEPIGRAEQEEEEEEEDDVVNIRFDDRTNDEESESVEDELYYTTYMPAAASSSLHRHVHLQTSGISAHIVVVMLRQARQEANRCAAELRPEQLPNIALLYGSAIAAATRDRRLQRRIIHEYELVCAQFPPVSEQQAAAVEQGRRARDEARSLEERRAAYRAAIRLTRALEQKRALKKEYNQFLLLLSVQQTVATTAS